MRIVVAILALSISVDAFARRGKALPARKPASQIPLGGFENAVTNPNAKKTGQGAGQNSGQGQNGTAGRNSGVAVGVPSAEPVSVGAGAGRGRAGNSNTPTGSSKPIVDENAPVLEVAQPSKGEGGGKKTAGSPPPAKIDQKPYFWPMCIFMSPGSQKVGNGMVKKLTDMAAKCNVQLLTFPFYVQSTSGKADSVAKAAGEKCNAEDGLKQFGVNRATALVVTDDEKMPAELCRAVGADPKDKKGCAEPSYDPGMGVRVRMQGTEGWAKPPTDRKTAVAILHSSATIQDFAYWTQGFSQMGRPPGPGGNRLGTPALGYSAALSEKEGWDKDGCDEMRKQSFKNPGFPYNEMQSDYVKLANDPKQRLNLFDKKQMWAQNPPTGKVALSKGQVPPRDASGLNDEGAPNPPAGNSGKQGAGKGGMAKGGTGGRGLASVPEPQVAAIPIGSSAGHKNIGQPSATSSGVKTVDGGYTSQPAISTAGDSTSPQEALLVSQRGNATAQQPSGGTTVRVDENASGSTQTANSGASNGAGGSAVASGSAASGGTNYLPAGSSTDKKAQKPGESDFLESVKFDPLEKERRRIPGKDRGRGTTERLRKPANSAY